VEKNTAQIDKLENEISALQSELDETNGRVSTLETSLETQTASLEKLTEIQTSLETQLQENNDEALLQLKHEVMTARALDMLGRARVYLAQSNFGLAKEDIQNARDLLMELQSETHEEVLEQVLERLDLTLGNLPAFPVVAAGDLEIAWQILISGEAAVIPVASSTPTLVLPVYTPTLVPSPTIEIVTTP
jgi:chromosome segregation ATPase